MAIDKTLIFEQNRRTLEGIAYRMLGTLADARDVVQDTYLKWRVPASSAQARRGSSTLRPGCWKSLGFRVTSVRPCANAVAAGRLSTACSGLPNWARRRPQRSATLDAGP